MTHSALLAFEELDSNPQAKFLDATFALPGSWETPRQLHAKKRIENAQFFDIQQIADPESDLPHMLPDAELFSEEISRLGISNGDTVIIYGQENIAMGPARAWWMFRAFGHQDVRVLNVSLNWLIKNGYPIISGKPTNESSSDVLYQACFKPHLVADSLAIKDELENQSRPILDARPAARFAGQGEEPRGGMRAGHIPESINIPAGELINAETGGLKDYEDLKLLLKDFINPDMSAPITTCGSGITACLLALACYELGQTEVAVYDGSWSEWGREEHNFPVSKSA